MGQNLESMQAPMSERIGYMGPTSASAKRIRAGVSGAAVSGVAWEPIATATQNATGRLITKLTTRMKINRLGTDDLNCLLSVGGEVVMTSPHESWMGV